MKIFKTTSFSKSHWHMLSYFIFIRLAENFLIGSVATAKQWTAIELFSHFFLWQIRL